MRLDRLNPGLSSRMIGSGYRWRQLSAQEREDLLEWRRKRLQPWHSPPHWRENFGHQSFHITAACWNHEPRIGFTPQRLSTFADTLLATATEASASVAAWCVLPNHYHLLCHTLDLPSLLRHLGRMHGRMSRRWNVEEQQPGRSNFYRCMERAMRSDAHEWCTMNYIHHNPVHHQYVAKWAEWPWSSAHHWLEVHGRAKMCRLWKQYPVLEYGRGWDDPDL